MQAMSFFTYALHTSVWPLGNAKELKGFFEDQCFLLWLFPFPCLIQENPMLFTLASRFTV